MPKVFPIPISCCNLPSPHPSPPAPKQPLALQKWGMVSGSELCVGASQVLPSGRRRRGQPEPGWVGGRWGKSGSTGVLLGPPPAVCTPHAGSYRSRTRGVLLRVGAPRPPVTSVGTRAHSLRALLSPPVRPAPEVAALSDTGAAKTRFQDNPTPSGNTRGT